MFLLYWLFPDIAGDFRRQGWWLVASLQLKHVMAIQQGPMFLQDGHYWFHKISVDVWQIAGRWTNLHSVGVTWAADRQAFHFPRFLIIYRKASRYTANLFECRKHLFLVISRLGFCSCHFVVHKPSFSRTRSNMNKKKIIQWLEINEKITHLLPQASKQRKT